MKKQRGRPPKSPDRTKGVLLQVRLEVAEKQAFDEAAALSGLTLSVWLRERLRIAARRELEKAGRSVAFLESARPPKPA
jgi:hypothetical protein